MKGRYLASTLLLTLISASPAYTHRRSLEDQLVHHVFSERPSRPVPNQLKINERHAKDVTILDLAGTITKGESGEALRSAVENLSRKGRNKILLNLARVTVIDSAGIGVLVSCYTSVGKRDGKIKLLNLTKSVQDLLVITKLLTVFDVYEDEAEAIKSFDETKSARAEPERRTAARETPPRKTEPTPCPTGSDTESALRKRIREIIADELGRNVQEVRADARFTEDLGADSLDAVELVMRFEEEFKIEIPDEDAEKLRRVSDVYCYIEKHSKSH